MKKILIGIIISTLCFSFSGLTQTFYFNDTETTLTKETDQSPAHWYIEVFSNLQTDSILRWKSDFVNIPTEWGINFDCQTVSFPTVNHNDSADFVFLSQPAFPQKLIIGAMLNDTPGNGAVFFDIYDPNNRQFSERIAFYFVVTLSPNSSLEESALSSILSIQQGILKNLTTTEFACHVFDLQGKEIGASDLFDQEIDLTSHRGEIVFIRLMDNDNNHYHVKVML